MPTYDLSKLTREQLMSLAVQLKRRKELKQKSWRSDERVILSHNILRYLPDEQQVSLLAGADVNPFVYELSARGKIEKERKKLEKQREKRLKELPLPKYLREKETTIPSTKKDVLKDILGRVGLEETAYAATKREGKKPKSITDLVTAYLAKFGKDVWRTAWELGAASREKEPAKDFLESMRRAAFIPSKEVVTKPSIEGVKEFAKAPVRGVKYLTPPPAIPPEKRPGGATLENLLTWYKEELTTPSPELEQAIKEIKYGERPAASTIQLLIDLAITSQLLKGKPFIRKEPSLAEEAGIGVKRVPRPKIFKAKQERLLERLYPVKEKSALMATDPQVEAALTAGLKERRIPVISDIAEKFRSLRNGIKRDYSYEYMVREYPELQNELRLFQDAPLDAQQRATNEMFRVVGGLNKQEYESFRRLVALQDFVETGGKGLKLPRDLPVKVVEKEFNRLMKIAPSKSKQALLNHNSLMKEVASDLIERGKAGQEILEGVYYPHRVLDYTAAFDERLPWLPKKLKTPYRTYLKERVGSIRDINTDYTEVMYRHLTKVHLDNALDDFVGGTATKYNVLEKLAKEQKLTLFGKRGTPRPGYLYDIGGVRYKGWQYQPGNQVFPAQTVNESLLNQAIEENLTVSEWMKLEGARGGAPLKELLAIGRKRPVLLLPEKIADRLNMFTQPRTYSSVLSTIRGGTRFWKRATLDFAGVPFQMNNFTGDLLNLYREDPLAFTKLPKSTRLLIKRHLPATDEALLALAKEQRVTVAGLVKQEVAPLYQAPFYKISHPIKARWARYNPMALAETFSTYRENIPRLAKLLKDIERIKAGRQVVADPDLIRGLTPIDAAGKSARTFTVDYGAVTPQFQRGIRGILAPFATFYVENAKNWGRYVVKHPIKTAVKFGVPYAAVSLWNNLKFPEVEKNLPEYYKYLPHINTGYQTSEGRNIVVAMQTPVDLAAQVVGLDRLPEKVREVARGEKTLEEAAKEQAIDTALGAPRLAWRLSHPFIQVMGEYLSNRDSFTGRQIVPDRLKGTSQGNLMMVENVLQGIITPYAQYLRASRQLEPGEPLLDWLLAGPFDIKRAFGIREVDIEAVKRGKVYEEMREKEIGVRGYLDQVEKAYISSVVEENPTILREKIEEIAKRPYPPSMKDIESRLNSTRVKKEVVEALLREEEDPLMREQLLKALEILKKAGLEEAKRRERLSIREAE